MNKVNILPKWVHPTLQGLAFWLAYKKQFYSGYKLSEGAIVGELAQGLSSNINKESELLECERMYKELLGNDEKNIRLDLVIGNKPINESNTKSNRAAKSDKGKRLTIDDVKFAIEVKRYENGWELIIDDLKRLKKLKDAKSDVRCFLIVACQDERPKKLVSEKFNPINKELKASLDYVKNRTVKKAFYSKKASNKGNFTVLIEVL